MVLRSEDLKISVLGLAISAPTRTVLNSKESIVNESSYVYKNRVLTKLTICYFASLCIHKIVEIVMMSFNGQFYVRELFVPPWSGWVEVESSDVIVGN